MKLTAKNIVKRNIFFSLDEVLISDDRRTQEKLENVFEFLKGLGEKGVNLFLVVGFHEDKAPEKFKEFKFKNFFKEENTMHVTEEYIKAKEEVDRERHLAQLDKDPYFEDKFFKQRVIMDLIVEGKITREDTALICHDIWFDGFYSHRFSGVDFFVVKKFLSERGRPLPEKIKGLNYINLSVSDFTKLLLGKFPIQDTRFLEAYVFNKLKLELFEGTKIDSLVKKSVLTTPRPNNSNE